MHLKQVAIPLTLAAILLLAACTQIPQSDDSPNISSTATTYTVTDLSEGKAGAVNNNGTVAIGRALASQKAELLRWSPAEGVQSLAVVNGLDLQALFISDSGVIAGVVDVGCEDDGEGSCYVIQYPFVWSPSRGFERLTLGGPNERSGRHLYMNKAGVVTGSSTTVNSVWNWNAYVWTEAAGIRALSTLGGISAPGGISDNGTIIGYSYTATNQYHNVVWSPSGSLQDFGANVSLTAINASGTVVGTRANAANQNRAFTWTAASGFRELGTLGGAWSSGWDIADDGSVAGSSVTGSSTDRRAFVWTAAGGMRNLGTLGGSSSDGNKVGGGSVTGYSYTADGTYRDFAWSAASGMQLLSLGGNYRGTISEVSNSGLVIGQLTNTSFTEQAFVWAPADGIQALPAIASGRSQALDINDSGWIVGQSAGRAALWRPASSGKQNQSITFTSSIPSNARVGGTYTVSATASSGLAVSFSSATTSICTVSGTTVRFVAAGTCTVRANQSGNASYNPAPTVSQSITVQAGTTTPVTYTLNFNNLTAGQIIASVAKGRGVTTTGPVTSSVSVQGLRKGKTGNVAMVQGTAKFLIISSTGTNQTPNPTGGTMTFGFSSFGTGKVTVKTIKVNSTSTTGGTVKVYNGSTLLKTVSVPNLGSGVSRTLTISTMNANKVIVTFTGVGKVDDLIVSQ